MKLIWHIVVKDLRRLRLPLALWTLLFLIRIFFCLRILNGGDVGPNWVMKQVVWAQATMTAMLLVQYLLVAVLVLEDSVVGDRMFWMTRPISGLRLLVAKLSAAALAFVVWPAVVYLLWGLLSTAQPGDLLEPLGRVIAWQALVTLGAFVMASLTGHAGRLLVWSLIAVAAIPTCIAFVMPKAVPRFFDVTATVAPYYFEPTLVMVPVMLSLLVAGLMMALIRQFRTRRLMPSLAWLIAALLAPIATALAWPKALTLVAPEETAVQGPLPTLRFERATLFTDRDVTSVYLRFNHEKTEHEWQYREGRLHVELLWSDGTRFRTFGSISVFAADHDTRLRQLLGLGNAPEPDTETQQHFQKLIDEPNAAAGVTVEMRAARATLGKDFGSFVLPAEYVERLKREPPQCTLHYEVDTMAPELGGTTRLQTGSMISGAGIRLAIQRIEERVMVDQKKGLPGQRVRNDRTRTLRSSVVFAQPATSKRGDPLVVVYSPTTSGLREFGGGFYENDLRFSVRKTYLEPFDYGLRYVTLSAPRVWRTDHWVELEANWDDLQVAAIVSRVVATSRQVLKIDQLVVSSNETK